MALMSSPEASASQTLALLDSAVSSTITSVSPHACFHWLEIQKARIRPQKLRIEDTGVNDGGRAAPRFQMLDNFDRSLTTRITLFPPAPIFVFS